jgi:hypothetical protein
LLPSDASSPRRREADLLFLILAASWTLRIFLVWSGGQDYWPDEVRYGRARFAVEAMARGQLGSVALALNQPDHPLFVVLGLLPAALERVLGPSTKIPAAFFATFSVATIFFLWVVLRRVGGDETLRLTAALLFALSTTQLYYSRHLLPYDAAMAFGIGALAAGLRSPWRPRDSVLCGLLAAAAALTYDGFWLLSAVAILVHVSREPRSPSLAVRRALLAGAGFVVPIAVLLGAEAAFGGDLARRMLAFSGTVVQGNFAEGWKLPFAYFWHAEHGIAALWGVGLVWAIRRRLRGDSNEALRLGLGGVAVVYGGLVLTSVILRRMVVYGRLARPMVPFLCILTALMLGSLRRGSKAGRVVSAAVMALVVIQAGANFATPIVQVFPPEFRALAARVAATRADRGALRLLYAEHIYPVPVPPPPDCDRVLIARAHPLQFLPYQYEGYRPEERAALRAADIRMRLVVCTGEPKPEP